jgi:putative hydrolase of the HAD superfamily
MPERPALDAVLFDAGGTLVRLDFEWMAEVLGELGVASSPERLRRAEIAGRRRYDASRGVEVPRPEPGTPLGASGDSRGYFAAMVEAFGAGPPLVEEALRRFAARHAERGLWSRPMEGARETIDSLGALGLRLAVISNSDGRAELHLRESGVLSGIEFVVDSLLVGVEKPDPAIFRIALERLAIGPERALFVGDIRSVDEAGARGAGTHFVLLDPFRDYAPPGVPAIPGIHALPAWVERHFETPRRLRSPRGPREVAEGSTRSGTGGDA